MTNAIAAYGTLLKIGDGGGPETFTTIAEVTSIGGPSLGLDMIDATSHDSTQGWEEVIGGILRSGEVTMELNFIPTEGTHNAATGLIADMVARTLRNFQMVFPDAGNTTWAFSALVNKFQPAAPVDNKLSASCTLKLSGSPILA